MNTTNYTPMKLLLKVWDLTDSLLMSAGSIVLMNIKESLGIIGFCITIFYTLWKWVKEIREDRAKAKAFKQEESERIQGRLAEIKEELKK